MGSTFYQNMKRLHFIPSDATCPLISKKNTYKSIFSKYPEVYRHRNWLDLKSPSKLCKDQE